MLLPVTTHAAAWLWTSRVAYTDCSCSSCFKVTYCDLQRAAYRRPLRQLKNIHNFVTTENRTYIDNNFFYHICPGNRSPVVTSITHRSPCIKRGEYSSVSGVNTKGWIGVIYSFWQAECLYGCHTGEIFTDVCINNNFIKTPKMSVSAHFMSVITNPADYSEEITERK